MQPDNSRYAKFPPALDLNQVESLRNLSTAGYGYQDPYADHFPNDTIHSGQKWIYVVNL